MKIEIRGNDPFIVMFFVGMIILLGWLAYPIIFGVSDSMGFSVTEVITL